MYLDKKEIIATKDFEVHEMEVPEWGGTILLRPLTGMGRDRWEREIGASGGDLSKLPDNFRARLIARCLVDEDGKRLFDEKENAKLGNKNAVVLGKIFEECQKISGLRAEDLKAAKENLD